MSLLSGRALSAEHLTIQMPTIAPPVVWIWFASVRLVVL